MAREHGSRNRIIGRLQIGHGLGGGFAPKIGEHDRISHVVGAVNPPRPITTHGSVRCGGVGLGGLDGVARQGIHRGRTGPDFQGRTFVGKRRHGPARAWIGRRPTRPRAPAAGQAGFQIAPVGKMIVLVVEIQDKAQADLAQIGNTDGLLALLLGAA